MKLYDITFNLLGFLLLPANKHG